MNKNILISGSTGFIGATLLGLYRQTNSFFAVSNQQPVKTEKCISSIASVDEISKFITENEIDVVIHLATQFIRNDDFGRTDQVLQANFDLPTRLICAASLTNVNKFIYAGSSWEKAAGDHMRAKNLYAAVKKSFDPIANYFAQTKNIDVIKLTLFDTYGPWDNRNKIVDLIIGARSAPLTISSPNHEINLTYSFDVCDAINCALINPKFDKGVGDYIVRSRETIKIRELIYIVEEMLETKLNVTFGDTPVDLNFIPEVNLPYVPGWSQKFSLMDGLTEKLKYDEVLYD